MRQNCYTTCYVFLLLLLLLVLVSDAKSELATTADDSAREEGGGLRGGRRLQQTATAATTSNSNNNTTAQSSEFRIVGGQDVPAGKYPFMASLEKGCGASLIAPDLLLSVAHCQELARSSDYAYIGSHLMQQGTARRITNVIPHPNYNEFTGNYDFMILTLDQPVEDIEPVQLNSDMGIPSMMELRKGRPTTRGQQQEERNSVGEFLSVIGFGVTDEGSYSLSERLQEVHVAYVPHKTCQSWYRDEFVDEATMFCAGFEKGGRDSCQGDSGSPILNNDGMQVGLVSWGQGCARPRSPGVYSRVAVAHSWITQQICRRSSQPPSGMCVGNGAILSAVERGKDELKHTLQIDIKLDANPEQVAWELINSDLGTVIDSMDYGSARIPHQELNVKYDDLIPGNYTFVVRDVAGDGILESGAGYILLSEITKDGGSSIIWAENGAFGGGTKKSFELKASQ